MTIYHEPKVDFMRDSKAREAWAMMASDPLLHRAFSTAIAELVKRGLSPDSLSGINSFIFTTLNLSEEKPVLPQFIPNKHLTSFGQSTETKTTVSET